MKFVLLILLSFTGFNVSSQPIIEWQKSLGGSSSENAYAIQQTTDGGYVAAGTSYSNDGDLTGNHGAADAWIVKLNPSGNIQWQKNLGGTLADQANAIQQTTDGGYIVAGYSESNNGDVSGNHGLFDIWIAKLNSSGNLMWQKCLGGSSMDIGHSIHQTADSGYVVTGYSQSNNGDVSGNHGFADFWVAKLNTSGAVQWQKSLGGSGNEVPNSIRQTADGGYIVAGFSDSNDGDVSGNHGSADYWVAKLNDSGGVQWQKSLGGSSHEVAKSIRQTTDGGYIVAGYSQSNDGDASGNHGDYDSWIVKLNATGDIEWQKSLGGTSSDPANAIRQTSDGGYVVAGYAQSVNGDVTGNHGADDFWLVKLNASGNLQWQKSLGGSGNENANAIHHTTDGGYIMAGYSSSNNGDVSGNHGNFDFWVVKLSADCETTDPVAVCQDITVNLESGGSVSITAAQLDGGSYDACSSVQLSANPSTFSCADTGVVSTVLTVTDSSGNTSTCNSMVTVTDTASNCTTCTIQLVGIAAGWNMISGYVLPDDPDLDVLFTDIAPQIILLKDIEGNVYLPGILNQVGEWNVVDSYQVKAQAATTLQLQCLQVDPVATPLALEEGWTLISYLRDTPMDATTAWASIINDIVFAKDENGNAFIPSVLNQIGDLQPGQGYQVKLANAATFTYPAND